jgi:hypothetical protein
LTCPFHGFFHQFFHLNERINVISPGEIVDML